LFFILTALSIPFAQAARAFTFSSHNLSFGVRDFRSSPIRPAAEKSKQKMPPVARGDLFRMR